MTSAEKFLRDADRAFSIRPETEADARAREILLDAAMGPGRFRKSSERLRAGRRPADALVAVDEAGALIGTVRLWHVEAGGVRALLLGPLAVDAAHRKDGIGAALMRASVARAKEQGHGAILLMGDAGYYRRFGFCADLTRDLAMPGPYELHRFLALELRPGALCGACGVLRATGLRRTQRTRRGAVQFQAA